MEHVSLRLRAAMCVAIATLFAVFSSGTAFAATTPAVPPAGEINDAQTQTNFAGSVIGTVDVGQCDDALATGTCNDFFLTTVTAQAERLVEVLITWPVALDPILESDLDLFVFECRFVVDPILGAQQICDLPVTSSIQDRGNFERVTFAAQSGDKFRVLIVPAFVFLQQDYSGCAAYVTGAVNCPDPNPQQQEEPVQAEAFLARCDGDTTTANRREIAGGGRLNGDNDEHFQLDVRERSQDGFETEGKVQWKDKGDMPEQRFRGQAERAHFTENGNEPGDNDTEGQAKICGFGTLEERSDSGRTTRLVCFESTDKDGGEPGAGKDDFNLIAYNLTADGTCVVATPVLVVGDQNTATNNVSAGNIDTNFRR